MSDLKCSGLFTDARDCPVHGPQMPRAPISRPEARLVELEAEVTRLREALRKVNIVVTERRKQHYWDDLVTVLDSVKVADELAGVLVREDGKS